MTCKEIIKKYLTENNFNGLVHRGECGCEIDDISPCDEYCLMCEPAYKWYCKKCSNRGDCWISDEYGDMKWCMNVKKQESQNAQNK